MALLLRSIPKVIKTAMRF